MRFIFCPLAGFQEPLRGGEREGKREEMKGTEQIEEKLIETKCWLCLLYTSDAADE